MIQMCILNKNQNICCKSKNIYSVHVQHYSQTSIFCEVNTKSTYSKFVIKQANKTPLKFPCCINFCATLDKT